MIMLVVASVLTPFLLTILVWFIWHPRWMGYAGLTLWDWIKVLSVPLVVGFVTFLISAVQAQIEIERAAENAAQGYFQRIGQLALDERLEGRQEIASALGRAETVAVLRIVEGERAGRVFAFLAEMGLLKQFAVEFQSLNLSKSELKGYDLSGLDFEDSNLRGTDFEDADLSDVDFEGADLRDVDFKDANLSGADFAEASVRRAEFEGANLSGADLS